MSAIERVEQFLAECSKGRHDYDLAVMNCRPLTADDLREVLALAKLAEKRKRTKKADPVFAAVDAKAKR